MYGVGSEILERGSSRSRLPRMLRAWLHNRGPPARSHARARRAATRAKTSSHTSVIASVPPPPSSLGQLQQVADDVVQALGFHR